MSVWLQEVPEVPVVEEGLGYQVDWRMGWPKGYEMVTSNGHPDLQAFSSDEAGGTLLFNEQDFYGIDDGWSDALKGFRFKIP